jgi:hypothetical protein
MVSSRRPHFRRESTRSIDGPSALRAEGGCGPQSDSVVPDYGVEDEEPLSLAEEIAGEVERGDETDDRYEKIKQGEIHIAELQKMSMAQLIDEARQENLVEVAGMKNRI